ncbi:hypothetical protein HRbin30_03289 [bacterium HR30]|nr:hypothetical protein HRbin30_03289 [bacterium HR30]
MAKHEGDFEAVSRPKQDTEIDSQAARKLVPIEEVNEHRGALHRAHPLGWFVGTGGFPHFRGILAKQFIEAYVADSREYPKAPANEFRRLREEELHLVAVRA